MIKIENIDTWGFKHAIRAMRNPMNSWDKSDSAMCYEAECHTGAGDCEYCCDERMCIGENDLDLMQRLNRSGVEHRTYARMIMVSMDITAPLYWWKEMDRYRMGKEQISCSTMHKIAEKEFTMDDFSEEHLSLFASECLEKTIGWLNEYRTLYRGGNDKCDWWQMIQLLPSSYNQRRTVMMSYETCMKIIRERENHKLDEWREFVKVLKGLPYMAEIMEGTA